jgi:hypothetical protein
MTSSQILDELQVLGVAVQVNGPNIRLDPINSVPPGLMAEIRQQKPELIRELREPYADKPPETEQELRQLMDHLEDPENFTKWLEWAMGYTDPAEDPRQTP